MSRHIPSTWHLITGLLIWAVWFSMIYGGVSVACQIAPPEPEQGIMNWINGLLLISGAGVTLLLVLLGLGYLRRIRVEREALQSARFLNRVAAAVCLAAALSTLFTSLPMLFLPPCV